MSFGAGGAGRRFANQLFIKRRSFAAAYKNGPAIVPLISRSTSEAGYLVDPFIAIRRVFVNHHGR